MTDQPQLQRSYRRLLLAYPREYRATRGPEILTTLLDAAAPGQRRPSARDAADLVAGGVRTRVAIPGGVLNVITATVVALLVGVAGAALGGWAAWSQAETMPTMQQALATAQTAFGASAEETIVDDANPYELDVLGKSTAPGDQNYDGPSPATSAIHAKRHTTSEDYGGFLTQMRQRLDAAGWTTSSPVYHEHAALFWANKADLVVRVEATQADNRSDEGSSWRLGDPATLWVSVHRTAPAATTVLAGVGLLVGGVLGWLFAAWALRAAARHGGRGRLAMALIGVPTLLAGVGLVLLPVLGSALGLVSIDGWSPQDSLIAAAILRNSPIVAIVVAAGLLLTGVVALTAPRGDVSAPVTLKARHPVLWLAVLMIGVIAICSAVLFGFI